MHLSTVSSSVGMRSVAAHLGFIEEGILRQHSSSSVLGRIPSFKGLFVTNFQESEKLLIVAHDAGGAQILASYAAVAAKSAAIYVEGPAEKIFSKHLTTHTFFDSLVDAVNSSTVVLTGSGWSSDLEWRALRMAKNRGARSVTFLDHWVNYRTRFVRDGVEALPDEIWVGDWFAHQEAERVFPEIPVRLEPNPYFAEIRERARQADAGRDVKSSSESPTRVLYAAEPASSNRGYDEAEALDFFFSHLGRLLPGKVHVTIRAHPSEDQDKYRIYKDRWPNVRLSGEPDLVEEVIAHDVVVGCQTMALAVSALAGRQSISAIPHGGGTCLVPFEEIEDMRLILQQ